LVISIRFATIGSSCAGPTGRAGSAFTQRGNPVTIAGDRQKRGCEIGHRRRANGCDRVISATAFTERKMPFDRSSTLCAMLLVAAATLFALQHSMLEAHHAKWVALPELTWQDWVTSIACTANDDAACAVAAGP
jgi:hypothetical protein